MFKEHLAILMERFPLLGLMASSFPYLENNFQDVVDEPVSLPDVKVLYVYGLSLRAYELIKPWLVLDASRRLIFLENREEIFGSFLQTSNASACLSDTQVEFHFLPKGRHLSSTLEKIANAHPVNSLDVISARFHKTTYFRKLRLELLRKTMLSEAIFKDRSHGYQLFFNFVRNAKHLESSFYLNALQGAFSSVPAIICGAGPSLSSAFKILETLENKALIFACGSAIAAFSAAGVSPHFSVAVDPNEEEFFRLKNGCSFEAPLIYSTRVHPNIFSTLNGPLGYARSQFGDISQLWLEEELGLLGPRIGSQLSSESISVTSMAVASAEWLGCSPILFAGLDMAYTGQQRYCSSVGVSETHKDKSSQITPDRVLAKKDRKGKKVYSAVRWVMESSSLSRYAKLHPQTQFINTTEGGLGFESIPYEPLNLAAQKFSQEYDLQGWIHALISSSPMPRANISEKLQELRSSLEKVIDHLHILSNQKPGSKALAELEMKEEIAFATLFYDIFHLLPQITKDKSESAQWPAFLELAQKYLAVME